MVLIIDLLLDSLIESFFSSKTHAHLNAASMAGIWENLRLIGKWKWKKSQSMKIGTKSMVKTILADVRSQKSDRPTDCQKSDWNNKLE